MEEVEYDMKAVQKLRPGEGHIALVETPEPTAPPGHVVLKVRAAGVCGTDLHILHGEFPTRPPVTLGHEVAGEIAEVGPDVTDWRVGERVVTETYYAVCGACPYCRQARPNLCPDRLSIGSKVNGGFAEYLEVPARNLHRIPENVDWTTAALTEPLACVVHAMNQVPIRPGDWIVVSGPGPMGLLTLQVARAAGGRTIVLGISRDRRRLTAAEQIGAERSIDIEQAGHDATVNEILAITEGGAPVVLECAGAGSSASLLLDVVRRKGHYGQIGLFGKPISVDLDVLCYKDLTMTGTNASVPEVWPRALELLQLGLVRSDGLISGVWPLERWEDAFGAMQGKGALKVLLAPDGGRK